MSRHLDGSPKPADPIWYRQHEEIRIRCRCGHAAREVVGPLARRAGMAAEGRLWQLVERLRCSRCGARNPAVEVGRWR